MFNKINSGFTVLKSPIIESKIKKDIQYIINQCLLLLGEENIKSIILGGGFGRGEGTAYIKDGVVTVINDYDFIIIHNKHNILFKLKNKNRLINLAENLAEKINIKQIDFHLSTEKELFNNKMNTIQHFELVNGHKVVFGNCNLISQSKITPNILLFDGSWLLRNRGLGLILAGVYFLGSKQHFNKINKQNLWIEINKAKLALGDAFLLSQNLYKKNLQERYYIFLECIKNKNIIFVNEYIEAVNSKINSIDCPYEKSIDELIEEWFKIINIYFKYLLDYEKLRYKKKYINWNEYFFDLKKSSYIFNLKFYYNLITSEHKNIPQKLYGAQLKLNKIKSISLIGLLLSSVKSKNKIDISVFEILKDEFNFINGIDNTIDSWVLIAKFLLLTIHPEGEAKKVAIS